MSAIAGAAFFILLALSFPVSHALVIGTTLGRAERAVEVRRCLGDD